MAAILYAQPLAQAADLKDPDALSKVVFDRGHSETDLVTTNNQHHPSSADMAAQLYKTASGRMFHAGELAIVFCGQLARGKTYTAHKLCRYLRWTGVQTSIFSIGDYRRRHLGPQDSAYFSDPATLSQRKEIADKCLDDLILFLKEGGQVGIYDGANTQHSRRLEIHDKLMAHGVKVLFIEAICDLEEVIEANIREVKISSPDYRNVDPQQAVADFKKRLESYQQSYETITDQSWSFIKDINVGDRLIVNRVSGYLPTRIVYYLMNLHISSRRIYLTRNGQTTDEEFTRTDAPLSPSGVNFSRQLPIYLDKLRRQSGVTNPLKVWTSPRQRSYGTSSFFNAEYSATSCAVLQRSSLVEMNSGVVDGMSEQAINEMYPEDFAAHQLNPYSHRYPRAESYHDVAIRLEDMLLEIEREKDDVLIIAHPTVLRCIYAYLVDRSESEIPTPDFGGFDKVGSLVELIPVAYGCKETRHHVYV